MIKISFSNSVYYLLVKYILFFVVLAFMGDRFKNAVINNAETSLEMVKLTFGYFLYILFPVFFLTVFFCAPLYYTLEIKNGIYFLLLLIVFYGIENCVYTYLCSPSDILPGIYNIIIGILLLSGLFYKEIGVKFSHKPIETKA